MDGAFERLGVGGYLGRIWRSLADNLELFLLLAVLWSILNTLLNLPLADGLNRLQSLSGTEDPAAAWAALKDLGRPYFLVFLGGMVLFSATALVWQRAVALGRNAVFAAGFFRRFLLIMWRFIGLMAISLLIVIAMLLFLLLASTVFGLVAQSGSTAGRVAGILLVLAILVGALLVYLPIYLGFLVSVATASLDEKRGIVESMRAIKGLWGPLIGAGLVIFLFYIIVIVAISILSVGMGLQPGTMSLWQLVVFGFIGAVFALAGLSLGLIALEQIKAKEASGSAAV